MFLLEQISILDHVTLKTGVMGMGITGINDILQYIQIKKQ